MRKYNKQKNSGSSMASIRTPLKVLAALGLASVGNNDDFTLLQQAQAVKMDSYQELGASNSEYLNELSSLHAHKKRHRKKRHHQRAHEPRPIPRENLGVDVEEVKSMNEQDSAEKATMDMIKEELSNEMKEEGGDDSSESMAEMPYNPEHEQQLHNQMQRLNQQSNREEEEHMEEAPGNFAAQRIFQQELDERKRVQDEDKQEAEAAARVHAQMSSTAKQMRGDPFGIDVRDNHPAFDANTYDVSEQHRQVELLKESSSNLSKKTMFSQPVQSAETANLIANAISHQMMKSQGLPEQDVDDGYGGPGVMGFSKRLAQATTPTRAPIQEPPKPNITQEELDEGQKMKPLSLSEQTMKDSVVQRTLNAMKAKHQQQAEEAEITRLSPYLTGPSPQAAPVPANPIKAEHKQTNHVQKQKRRHDGNKSDDEDMPEELHTKKVNLAEERDEAIAAMEDVEERQKKAVMRAQKKSSSDDEDSDDEKDSKKSSHKDDDEDKEARDEPKEREEKKVEEEKPPISPQSSPPPVPKSIAQITKELAVKRTIEAIKNRQHKNQQPQLHKQPIQEEPKPEMQKKQVENEFVPETTSDAKTFSRDLKNLEHLNSKFQKPLEAERQKELAERKAKEEWDKAIADDKKDKEQRLAEQKQEVEEKVNQSKDNKDYQIVTSKLEVDDSQFVPKQDRISFSQKESHKERKKHSETIEPAVLTQKKKEEPSFSIETSKLEEEDEDISNLIEKKQAVASKKSEKKTAVKKEKKKEKKKEVKKKEEDPYAFTIETTKMDFPVDDVREQPDTKEVQKKVQQLVHKKGGLQSSSKATSLIKQRPSVEAEKKKKVSDIVGKVKQRQLIKSITNKALANQKGGLQSLAATKSFPGTGEVSIAEKLASIAEKKPDASLGDPFDIFTSALSNTFKTDGDKASKLNDALVKDTLTHSSSSPLQLNKSIVVPGLQEPVKLMTVPKKIMPDIKNKKVLDYNEYAQAKEVQKDAFKEKEPELPREENVKIENHSKKGNKNLQEMIAQIFNPVEGALSNLGHQNNATISIVINDEKYDAAKLQALIQKQKKHRHKKKVRVGQLLNDIKNSMTIDKDELRRHEFHNDIVRQNHIVQVSESSGHKNSNAITDDYLKAVEASIDVQKTEEEEIHQNAVQKTLAIAKAAQDKKRKAEEAKARKAAEKAEKEHQAYLEKLKQEQEEHDAKVRMEAELQKQKHDDIIQKAIEKGKAMQPIIEKEKEEEEEKQLAEKKKELDSKKALKKQEEDDLKEFIKGKGTNSDLHSITQKLSSFTDMANSLKTTIDDVDAMKQVGGQQPSSFGSISSESGNSASTTSASSELKTQAKLNAKKAEELASQIVGKDPQNALKILEQQEKDDAVNERKMTPLASKKDEVVAKALFAAKENMKKINHPLTGFLMGDEGSSYAVQLNDTKSTQEMMAENKQDEGAKHNNTVKGAIVKFVKHLELHEKEEKKKDEAKHTVLLEKQPEEKKKEEKKDDKKPVASVEDKVKESVSKLGAKVTTLSQKEEKNQFPGPEEKKKEDKKDDKKEDTVENTVKKSVSTLGTKVSSLSQNEEKKQFPGPEEKKEEKKDDKKPADTVENTVKKSVSTLGTKVTSLSQDKKHEEKKEEPKTSSLKDTFKSIGQKVKDGIHKIFLPQISNNHNKH